MNIKEYLDLSSCRSAQSTPLVRLAPIMSRCDTFTSTFHSKGSNRISHWGSGTLSLKHGSTTVSRSSTSLASFRGPESFERKNKKNTDDGIQPFATLSPLDEVLLLVRLLPPQVRATLEAHPNLHSLVEVVMDLGRPPLARFPLGDVKLSSSPVTEADIKYAVEACGDFGGDNRAGIDGTLHRISAIRNRRGDVVGLTCRLGRAIQGSASMVIDLVTAGKSILMLGRPGVGKTTAIRELSRVLADDCCKRVVIVDTSNEIGGDGDVPHPGIGGARRMQVAHPEQQHRVMIEAVENHMPEVIVIDEIGTEAEALASRTIAQRGVQLIATAHGNELENVMKNPSLNDLVGGISSVTLGDDEAKRRGVQKSILERSSPPTFDVAIEMESRERWKVHLDVAWAVDQVLQGRDAGAEVRERDADGRVWAWPEDGTTSSSDEDDNTTLLSGVSLSSGGVNPEASSSSPSQSSNHLQTKKKRNLRVVETQPFPEAALRAARGQEGYDSMSRSSSNTSSFSILSAEEQGLTEKLKHRAASRKQVHVEENSSGLHVYLYGVDPDSVLSVVDALSLTGKMKIAAQIQDADAVLATRTKLKTSGWLKVAAQQAGIPVFALKTASVEAVVKGVRTLLGVDPTPVGSLLNNKEEAPMADPRMQSGKIARAETSIALVKSAPVPASVIQKGLEEAREAIESIVLKLNQPAELMPRPESIVERQIALAKGYGLRVDVVGTAASGGRRVRVLPMDYPKEDNNRKKEMRDRANMVSGATKKEYW